MGGQIGWVVGGRCGRIFGRHGHPVDSGVNVDAGSVPVGHTQRLSGGTGLAQLLLDDVASWRPPQEAREVWTEGGRERGRV